MKVREEINMMVKVAQAAQRSYMDLPEWKRLEASNRMFENEKKWIHDNGYDKGKVDASTLDGDIADNKKKQDIIKRQWEQRQQQQRQQNIVRNINGSQMIDATGRMPVAGRSIGTGYTGNEIRHGGTYATPPGGKPHNQIGTNEQGEAIYSDGNGGRKTYGQLASTQMMNRWNQVAKGGPKSQGWKDYVANSKQEAASYTPNNPYQYTYAGSQPRADQVTAGRYAQQNDVSGSEFGSDSDQGVEGSAYRGRIIPRTQGKIVERRVGAQVNPSTPRPPAKVPTAAPAVQNALQPPTPPPPAPTPTNPQVQNPEMYEDVGMDEQNIAGNWSGFVPNQPAQRPQPNPSISDEDIADINDYVKNLQNSQDQLVPDATKSTYSADRYLRANGLDTLEDLFR